MGLDKLPVRKYETRGEVRAELLKILSDCQVFPKSRARTVQDSDGLKQDLGFKSVYAIDVVYDLQDRLGLEVTIEDFLEKRDEIRDWSFGDFVNYVCGELNVPYEPVN